MMRKLRDNTHVVLWVLILAFVGTIIFSWGMGGFDTMTGDSKTVVASINGAKVEYADYEKLVQNRLQQAGDQTDNRQVMQARSQSWSDLVNLTLEKELAKEMGLGWSDREISDKILYSPPAFVTQDTTFLSNGVFDTLKWHDMLRGENAKNGLLTMEEQYRTAMPIEKLRSRLMAATLVSDANLMDDHLQRNQTALGRYLVFTYAAFPVDSGSIKDADLEAWYKDHQKDYEVDERREIDYVQLPVVPSKEDSADALDQLAYIQKQLEKGETFENLARIYSMDESNAGKGGDLGWFGKGRMVPEFDAAAFGAQPGQVVGPVQTRFGFHLLKVTGRELRDNGTGVKEDQVMASHILIKVEPSSMTHSDLRAKADALYEDVQNGNDFEVLCAERQLKIETGKPFTAKGFVPGLGRSQRATDLIFQAKAGEVISPVYLDNGGWFVVRVKAVLPKGFETLKERRQDIMAKVRTEKQKALALKAAEAWLAAAHPAGLDSTMALPQGAEYGRLDQPARIGQFMRGNIGRDLAFTGTLFKNPVGALSKPVAGERGVYIIQVEQRDDAKTILDQLAAELPAKRLEQRNSVKGSIYGNWSSWTKEKAEIKDHRSRFGIDY